jgi:hypothetical protein
MRSFLVVAGENALAQQFTNLRHDARGGSFLHAHQQLGALALPTNPTSGQTLTLTINGTAITITFVSAIGTTAGNVLIGASAAATVANLIALLNQPQTTTATGVALSAANQALVSYLTWPLSGTTITPSSNNISLYAPLSTFTASTTATGGSYTAQTMQLYVEPGVFYIAGTRVIFTGGSTPTVTAPSANPRIDVLSINSSGTLAWTTGAENASPVAPTYPNPASNLVLCELYNVVGETALYDNSNQIGGQGYIYNDVRQFEQPSMNWGAFSTDLIPDADGTRNLGSSGTEWNNIYAKTAVYVSGVPITGGKFGGTGADGALTVSSGTTTIDVGAAKVFIKNYTSISITGTGKVVFTNPHSTGTLVILRSQGNVTLTSSAVPMLDASAMGAAGGASVSQVGIGTIGGNVGNVGALAPTFITNPGSGGTTSTGTGGAISTTDLTKLSAIASDFLIQYPMMFVGSGGGSGGVVSTGSGTINSGKGGLGGGALVIECNGAWNFTTAGGISVAGGPGGNGDATSGTGNNYDAEGGGGGSAGSFLGLYNALTANTGTVTTSGGVGGNTNSTNFAHSTNFGGGGGGSPVAAGNNGTDAGSANSKGGADGATGMAWILQNHTFS